MKIYCKIIGNYEIRQYQGYHSEEYLLKNRYVILENGVYLLDEHMSLTECVRRFKALVKITF